MFKLIYVCFQAIFVEKLLQNYEITLLKYVKVLKYIKDHFKVVRTHSGMMRNNIVVILTQKMLIVTSCRKTPRMCLFL